jgi:hypothetical protein
MRRHVVKSCGAAKLTQNMRPAIALKLARGVIGVPW